MCNGSTHALGGLSGALKALRGVLARNGVLLISDGYWQRPPSESACRALGAQPSDFRSLEATVALVEDAGHLPVHVATTQQPGPAPTYRSATRPATASPDEVVERVALAVRREPGGG